MIHGHLSNLQKEGIFAWIFIASTVVNLVMYVPLGLLTRVGIISLIYMRFLIVTIIVFIIDFGLILIFFRLKGYAKLHFSGANS